MSAARGNPDEAASLATAAIDAYEKLDCCYGQRALAFALRAQVSVERQQLTAAQAEAARALDEAKTAQGSEPYSFYTAHALRALGMVREAQGLHREASAAYKLAAENFANTLGPQTQTRCRQQRWPTEPLSCIQRLLVGSNLKTRDSSVRVGARFSARSRSMS